MGFAQEMRDFATGFKMTQSYMDSREDRAAAKAAGRRKVEREDRKDAQSAQSNAEKARIARERLSLDKKKAGSTAEYYKSRAESARIAASRPRAARSESNAARKARELAEAVEDDKFDGLPQNFADGGLVRAAPQSGIQSGLKGDREDMTPPRAVTPEVTPSPASEPAPAAPAQQGSEEDRDDAAVARDLGVKTILDGVGTSDVTTKKTALPTGKPKLSLYDKALKPEESKALMDQIDPEGTLPASLKQLRKLSKTYRFYAGKGDMKSAREAAQAILLEGSLMVAQYGDEAEKAIKSGNTAKGAALMETAYNNWLPDGKTVEIDEKGMAVFKDAETGELVVQGKMTPGDLLTMATGFKNGKAYWDLLGEAAKPAPGRDKAPKPKKPLRALSGEDLADKNETAEGIELEITEAKKANPLPEGIPADSLWGLVKDIVAFNGGKAAATMGSLMKAIDAAPPTSGQPPFGIEKEDDRFVISMPNGEKFELPERSRGALSEIVEWYKTEASPKSRSAIPNTQPGDIRDDGTRGAPQPMRSPNQRIAIPKP